MCYTIRQDCSCICASRHVTVRGNNSCLYGRSRRFVYFFKRYWDTEGQLKYVTRFHRNYFLTSDVGFQRGTQSLILIYFKCKIIKDTLTMQIDTYGSEIFRKKTQRNRTVKPREPLNNKCNKCLSTSWEKRLRS